MFGLSDMCLNSEIYVRICGYALSPEFTYVCG